MEHIWEMPEIQALHRLPSRSPLLPWADSSLAAQDAASGPENRDLSSNSFYKCLDGEWKFRFFESPSIIETKPEFEQNGWTKKSYNDDDWDTISRITRMCRCRSRISRRKCPKKTLQAFTGLRSKCLLNGRAGGLCFT